MLPPGGVTEGGLLPGWGPCRIQVVRCELALEGFSKVPEKRAALAAADEHRRAQVALLSAATKLEEATQSAREGAGTEESWDLVDRRTHEHSAALRRERAAVTRRRAADDYEKLYLELYYDEVRVQSQDSQDHWRDWMTIHAMARVRQPFFTHTQRRERSFTIDGSNITIELNWSITVARQAYDVISGIVEFALPDPDDDHINTNLQTLQVDIINIWPSFGLLNHTGAHSGVGSLNIDKQGGVGHFTWLTCKGILTLTLIPDPNWTLHLAYL